MIKTPPYLINGVHRITINLIGCGGTGSLVATKLARFHKALNFLDHPGLFVTIIDPDKVEEFNIGRQMYVDSDIGRYKADATIQKINFAFNLDWEAKNRIFGKQDTSVNIVISAVDNVRTRKQINKAFFGSQGGRDLSKRYFLIDCGNGRDYGQVVLTDHKKKHKTIFDLFPDLEKHEERDDQGDCGYFELLQKQDLFINDWVSIHVMAILKDLYMKKQIDYQGFFFNSDEFQTQKIMI